MTTTDEPTVIITGYLDVPDLDRAEVLGGLADVTARSRLDPGCIEYWWAEDLDRPMRFRFYECWESADHLAAHRAQPYEAEFVEQFVSRCRGADATVCTVTDRRAAR